MGNTILNTKNPIEEIKKENYSENYSENYKEIYKENIIDVKTNDKNEFEVKDDQIFEKIIKISNDLINEYNNEFLKKDFCDKIAFIYQKKLSKFNIKLLKNIYNNINSQEIDNEIIVTIQDNPSDNDKFIDFSNIFKEGLIENFWDKNIDIDPSILIDKEELELERDKIISTIKSSKKYYINPKHVNILLENKINTMVGGENVIENKNKLTKKNKQTENMIETNNKNLNKYFNINSFNNLSNSNNSQNNFENNVRNNSQNNSQNNVRNNMRNNVPNNVSKNISRIGSNSKQNNIIIKNIHKKIENLSLKNHNKSEPIKENNKKLISKINKSVNLAIENNIHIPEESINTFVKYFVPKKYNKPTQFCNNNEENCKLTKSQLCQTISENFIIRNNIIAAILTTIPYKNEKGIYEGGICYQKFLNLEYCTVCVPINYRDLKKKKISDILNAILDKANNLDEDECNKNKGYYYKLSDREKEILKFKAYNQKTSDNKNNSTNITNNYNLLFINFLDKLKKYYFEQLNKLIIILENIQDKVILNNKMLNLISLETKKTIDRMYTLCNYYYIYGIISLINSDTSENVIIEDNLKDVVITALDKKITNLVD